MTLSEVVTTKSGRKITVTTTREENEALDVFVARHNAAIAAVEVL